MSRIFLHDETIKTWWGVTSNTIRLKATSGRNSRRNCQEVAQATLFLCPPLPQCPSGVFVGPGGTAQSSGRSVSQQSGSSGARAATFRHNYCITQQCFPPLFPSSALPAHLRLPPNMNLRIYSRLLRFYRHLLSEHCLLLPNCCGCYLMISMLRLCLCSSS